MTRHKLHSQQRIDHFDDDGPFFCMKSSNRCFIFFFLESSFFFSSSKNFSLAFDSSDIFVYMCQHFIEHLSRSVINFAMSSTFIETEFVENTTSSAWLKLANFSTKSFPSFLRLLFSSSLASSFKCFR